MCQGCASAESRASVCALYVSLSKVKVLSMFYGAHLTSFFLWMAGVARCRVSGTVRSKSSSKAKPEQRRDFINQRTEMVFPLGICEFLDKDGERLLQSFLVPRMDRVVGKLQNGLVAITLFVLSCP